MQIPAHCGAESDTQQATASIPSTPNSPPGPLVTLTYCTQCQWLLRAGWMAQELLSTFGTDLGGVKLVPGTGGVFTIDCDGTTIWDRRVDGGFPDVRTLKQRVRDRIAPDRDLGHLDRPTPTPTGP